MIPNDCVGHILQFVSSTKTFFKLYILCKEVQTYLEQNSIVTQNILFRPRLLSGEDVDKCQNNRKNYEKIKKNPIRGNKKYVSSLSFNDKSYCCIESLLIFPNVKNLSIQGFTYPFTQKIIDELTYLEYLEELNLKYFMGNFENKLTLKRIKKLTILQGTIDIDFENMKTLEELSVCNTEYQIEDKHLKNLKKLKKLSLRYNKSSSEVSDQVLSTLTKLQKVVVDNLLLEGSGLTGLKGLRTLKVTSTFVALENKFNYNNLKKMTNLRTLEVSAFFNDIRCIEPLVNLERVTFMQSRDVKLELSRISKLTKLKSIILRTSITDEEFVKFCKTSKSTNLSSICICSGKFTDDSIRSIENFKNLQEVELLCSTTENSDKALKFESRIKRIRLWDVEEFLGTFLPYHKHLENLKLDISYMGDEGLDGLFNLKTLALNYTDTTSEGVASVLKNSKKLEEVSINLGKKVAMDDSHLKLCGELQYLRKLSLSKCEVTEKGIVELLGCDCLEKIDFWNNKIINISYLTKMGIRVKQHITKD